MKSRLAVIIAAVIVPLAVLGFVVTRGGGSSPHKPAPLPIAAAGAGGTEQAARADTALYPYGGIVYQAGPDLPALDGSARAYKVTIDRDATDRLSAGGAGSVASSGVAVACAPDATECPVPPTTIPQRPADLPSHDEAQQLALDTLRAAGMDVSSVAVTVDDLTTQWSVRVDPIVDGIATVGFGAYVSIGDHGVIQYVSGTIGHVERVDDYPLIGTAKAIELLNEGRGFIGPMPMEAIDTPALGAPTGDVASGGASSGNPGTGARPPEPDPQPEPPITTGTFAPPPPQQVTLTGAERVLMFASSYDGTDGYLVPGYRFHTADGEGPTVLAIDESFLAPPPGTLDSGSGSTGGGKPGVIEPQPAPAPDQAPPETVEPPRDQ